MNDNLKENSAIQNHINILQNVINRMAGNSANSKTWAITIISAIMVLLFDKKECGVLYFAYIPLVMFFLLDCCYLGLERHFRKLYNQFVTILEADNFNFKDVYKLQGPKKLKEKITLTLCAAWSFSTTPFYVVLALSIFIVSKIIK